MTPEEVRQNLTLQAFGEWLQAEPSRAARWNVMTPQQKSEAWTTMERETDCPECSWTNIREWLGPRLDKAYDEGKLPQIDVAERRLRELSDAEDVAIIQNP